MARKVDLPSNLLAKLDQRKKEGLFRTLALDEGQIDFWSNDYLGYARKLEAGAKVMGSTGSRLISGNSALHESVERALARFFSSPEALIFNSGYDANLGLLGSILQRNDIVFYDALSHASIRDGIRLGRAKSYGFKHNDLSDLEAKLKRFETTEGQRYVVVESVYSMDGDLCPLEDLVEASERYDFYLIVDEAHATGVLGEHGRGLVVDKGFEKAVFARMHTFGKAMGAHGAAVLGHADLKDFLINYARSFIYTTALSQDQVFKIEKALERLGRREGFEALQLNIDYFHQGLRDRGLSSYFIPSPTAIQSFVPPSHFTERPDFWTELSAQMKANKIMCKAIHPPTVPQGEDRLRICLHAFNTKAEIDLILQLLSTFV